MPSDLEDAAFSFEREIAPASQPRDVRGKLVETSTKPESMFSPREIEGDAVTGDTRDGGDNERLRAREKAVADGRNEREGELSKRDSKGEVERPQDGEDDGDAEEGQRGELEADAEDDGERYEVIVDGKTQEVSLQEALRGYVREATFHQRMEQLNDVQRQIDVDLGNLNQNWKMWNKAKADFEEDVVNITPKEPDWDVEFSRDPQNAFALQKIHNKIKSDLAKSRQARAEREALQSQENDRRVQKYAVDGFQQFVMNHIKELSDKPTLERNLKSMRRTALAAGFSDYEVTTVYDPRMLTILYKASRFDRMTATQPRAVVSGKGKTLTPGAATPLSGNARRSGLDEAQRRLAQTGKLDDAEQVFRKMF
jgi:hypothetical protein